MREKLYVIVFALVISAAAAIVLTFSNAVLKERIERNRQLEVYMSVMKVLGIETDETAGFEAIERDFREHTEAISRETTEAGEVKGMDIYRGVDNEGNTIGYAVKISGPGFWGPIAGFLALEPDLKTIKGLDFFEQEETPGLGGRIVEDEFLRQFVGKQIYGPDTDKAGFKLTAPRGKMFDLELVGQKGINEVDGITGATETTSALQRFLNEGLKAFQEFAEEKGLADEAQ
jgi:Na+-transporting NADH:ubiquinone oxidoreductase subunit C